MKRTARMFDDRATPRSPFVVAYSPRSHPDTLTDFSLSSTLRFQFGISVCEFVISHRSLRTNPRSLLNTASENTQAKQAKRSSSDLCRYKCFVNESGLADLRGKHRR